MCHLATNLHSANCKWQRININVSPPQNSIKCITCSHRNNLTLYSALLLPAVSRGQSRSIVLKSYRSEGRGGLLLLAAGSLPAPWAVSRGQSRSVVLKSYRSEGRAVVGSLPATWAVSRGQSRSVALKSYRSEGRRGLLLPAVGSLPDRSSRQTAGSTCEGR